MSSSRGPTSVDGADRRITLLTDFGTSDGYVAAMRGVIATLAPRSLVEDAGHDLPPGDVEHAMWTVDRYWNRYPPGTIHVIVVDPGVGSERRALVGEVDRRLFVAPDNGVLTAVLANADDARLRAIVNPDLSLATVSSTFHGRDVFAPAAAHLAAGVALERFGPPVSDAVRLDLPTTDVQDGSATGRVVHVDRFGNLITNIRSDVLEKGMQVVVAGTIAAHLMRTYADVAPGEIVALIGSGGTLEISVRDGNAAGRIGVGRGAPVRVARIREDGGYG